MSDFPYLIPAEDRPEHGDSELSTLNQLILHGARYHRRDTAFFHASQTTSPNPNSASAAAATKHPTRRSRDAHPDWRADRLSIRIALALRERFGLTAGDGIAIDWPFDWRWLLVERAILALGAFSVTPPQASASSSASAGSSWLQTADLRLALLRDESRWKDAHHTLPVVLSGPLGEGLNATSLDTLLEYGGTLDTPERATGLRALARSVPSESLASIDWTAGESGRWTQGRLASEVHRFLTAYSPLPSGVHLVLAREPSIAARIVSYAGWADGQTATHPMASNPSAEDARLWAPDRLFSDRESLGPWPSTTKSVLLDEI